MLADFDRVCGNVGLQLNLTKTTFMRSGRLSRNRCIDQIVLGTAIKFCCCNTGDLCNSKLTNLTVFQKAKERLKDLLDVIG
ncbi:unnamed protein product [Heligmosomoides polygyrus]|uniref:Reverse transcriptase domain-containing protein n=1 Tax=Heligmosomoides polygyrus TaxID=6339 RepID=A0A183G8F9_HELPZ|nr:unnamed protein product [Heligmosomoides polygyrus]